MSSLRACRWAAVWFSYGATGGAAACALAACTRPGMASLLPALEIGCSARRELDSANAARSLDHQRWEAVGFVGLRFRARSVAADVPARSELAPEAWLAPCDSDDEICLQEAADAEQEIATALGELQ